MASDESMTVRSCTSTQEDDFDHDDDPLDHKDFSRLSVCNSTSIDDQQRPPNQDYVYDLPSDLQDHTDTGMYHMMSGLSIESFDGDVEDEALSDGLKPTEKGLHHGHMGLTITSDSDEESVGGCYSLPATPPRMRGRNHRRTGECVSENEGAADRSRRRRWRRRRMIMNVMEMDDRSRKTRSDQRVLGHIDDDDDDDEHSNNNNNNYSTGGDSQSESSSAPPMVMITRPKGGKRSLRMDLEEVKACRELGFELETPFPLPLPLHTASNLSADTSTTSAGNSPVHWRISSPGDDPRDVKARLKVWAQAVAIASTTRQAN